MVLQETYEVLDADYLDRATSSDPNDNGWNTTMFFTRNTNSTNLYEDRTDSSSVRYVRPLSALGLSVEEQDYCVEVTIPSGEVNKFQIRRQNDNGSGSGQNVQYYSLSYTYTAPTHIKAIMKKDLFQLFVDGSTEPVLSSTATRTHFTCGFSLSGGTISNVDFKDLVIYKI